MAQYKLRPGQAVSFRESTQEIAIARTRLQALETEQQRLVRAAVLDAGDQFSPKDQFQLLETVDGPILNRIEPETPQA